MLLFARTTTTALLLLSTLFSTVDRLAAHPLLVSPNGGEVLRVGDRITIKWSVLIAHQQKNWDLYYSTTGDLGPWKVIKLDMPVKQLSYVWTVPHQVSSKVRFRIDQDNVNFNYADISNKDSSIKKSLTGNKATISLATGGTQTLKLEAGATHANRGYWLVGSASGTKPGFALGNVVVPLKYDVYTDLMVAIPNNIILGKSKGTLDKNGTATATFTLPKGLASNLVGLTIYHAFITTKASTVQMASNAEPVTLAK